MDTAERAAAYRALFTGHLDTPLLAQIRHASNSGLALGNERFKEEVERLSGRRVELLKRGPKAKKKDDQTGFLH